MTEKDDSGVSVQLPKSEELDTTSAIIFQCAQCNSIVGDSTSWLASNKVMRCITIRSVTSKVGVKTKIEISQSGIDIGSTFYDVYCLSCNEVVGKQYVASPPGLDLARGFFTLNVEKLNTYETGSADVTKPSDTGDLLTIPNPKYMQVQLNKIRFLLLNIDDRVKTIEDKLAHNGNFVSPIERPKEQLGISRDQDHHEDGSVACSTNVSVQARADLSNTDRPDSEERFISRKTEMKSGKAFQEQERGVMSDTAAGERFIGRKMEMKSGKTFQEQDRGVMSDTAAGKRNQPVMVRRETRQSGLCEQTDSGNYDDDRYNGRQMRYVSPERNEHLRDVTHKYQRDTSQEGIPESLQPLDDSRGKRKSVHANYQTNTVKIPQGSKMGSPYIHGNSRQQRRPSENDDDVDSVSQCSEWSNARQMEQWPTALDFVRSSAKKRKVSLPYYDN